MAKPVTYPHRRVIQFEEELKEKIENFRFQRRYKTEADAIRDLIRIGLDAASRRDRQAVHEAKEATDQRIEQGEDGPVRQTIGYREGATGRFVHLGEGETSKAGVERRRAKAGKDKR